MRLLLSHSLSTATDALPPAETTHLVLNNCATPFEIAPLLTLTVPLLTHGLVVLDIGDCGLSEIPSAIASCCFLYVVFSPNTDFD